MGNDTRSVVTTNGRAVMLLEYGLYDESIHLLGLTLQALLFCFSPNGGRHPDELCAAGDQDVTLRTVDIWVRDSDASGMGQGAGQQLEQLVEGNFALYSGALIINGGDDQLVFEGNRYRISAAILYNAGLAYHLMGVRRPGRNQEKFFRRALNHYRNAARVIRRGELQQWTPSDNLLSLAIYNNLGWLHSYFLDVGQARNCLMNLNMILESSRPVMEFEHFQLTVILFEGRPLAAAPAA